MTPEEAEMADKSGRALVEEINDLTPISKPSFAKQLKFRAAEAGKPLADWLLDMHLMSTNEMLNAVLSSFTGDSRVEWHLYFMTIAKMIATRATCDRKRVGCVIVGERRILTTGYNGSMPGIPHCDDAGHQLDANGRCVRTVHAEGNAVGQAAKHGIKIAGSVAYVTASPCRACFKLLTNAGITEVIYEEPYRVEEISRDAHEAGVRLYMINRDHTSGDANSRAVIPQAETNGIDPSIVRFVPGTHRIREAGQVTLCTHLLGPCACGQWHTDEDNGPGKIRVEGERL